jgi:hypothetical protein
MKNFVLIFCLLAAALSCGLKVVDPDDQKNKGALAVDASGGSLKLVPTYTCKVQSMAKRFSATGKSEDDAKKEVLAKCRDASIVSFCKSENIKCFKN